MRIGPQTGAGDGKRDTPVTKSRWFDIGNARVGAEDKNKRHSEKKAAKKDAKEMARLEKKKGFWS